MSTDISELKGDDLFAALSSGDFKVSKPAKASKPKATGPRPIKPTWEDISVCLLVHHTDCQCGHSFETPNPILFVKRRCLRTGALHYRGLDDIDIFAESYREKLPAEIIHERKKTKDCQHCFGLTHLFRGDSIEHSDVEEIVFADKPKELNYQAPSCDAPPRDAASDAQPVNPKRPEVDHFASAPAPAEDEDWANLQLEV